MLYLVLMLYLVRMRKTLHTELSVSLSKISDESLTCFRKKNEDALFQKFTQTNNLTCSNKEVTNIPSYKRLNVFNCRNSIFSCCVQVE
jgi:hypothetical protein